MGLSPTLQQLAVAIVHSSFCSRHDWYGNLFDKQTMACAVNPGFGRFVCNGDDGGPLQCYHDNRWKLVGVASIPFPLGCAVRGKPMVYTRVYVVLNWIAQHVQRM